MDGEKEDEEEKGPTVYKSKNPYEPELEEDDFFNKDNKSNVEAETDQYLESKSKFMAQEKKDNAKHEKLKKDKDYQNLTYKRSSMNVNELG